MTTKDWLAAVLMACSVVWIATEAKATVQEESPEVAAARKSRDASDVEGLRKAVNTARGEAQQRNTAQAYERLALFDLWLCEAGHGHDDDTLIKSAATDGVAAAEKAVALNPNSSEAHRLQGDLLGELIPHVFAGGVRYGRRSTSEVDKAIELDPRNANAYIARAISYFFTPAAFGGSRDKAVDMLKRAIALDPASDTAHIWLAQVYLAADQTADAQREINEARRINPGRGFVRYVEEQIKASEKKQIKK
jgi:tetratricopeptide (TPR) repeat protein